jgi:hypothetical protein
MLTRRAVLGAAAGFLTGVAHLGSQAGELAAVVEVHMKSDPQGMTVRFDPVGGTPPGIRVTYHGGSTELSLVLLEPGQTVPTA